MNPKLIFWPWGEIRRLARALDAETKKVGKLQEDLALEHLRHAEEVGHLIHQHRNVQAEHESTKAVLTKIQQDNDRHTKHFRQLAQTLAQRGGFK
jgi:DNA repair exonuclease SbcCD ATPase subunit